MNGQGDAAQAVGRLEAALERIARSTAFHGSMPRADGGETSNATIAARLDVLIDQLRVALSSHPD